MVPGLQQTFYGVRFFIPPTIAAHNGPPWSGLGFGTVLDASLLPLSLDPFLVRPRVATWHFHLGSTRDIRGWIYERRGDPDLVWHRGCLRPGNIGFFTSRWPAVFLLPCLVCTVGLESRLAAGTFSGTTLGLWVERPEYKGREPLCQDNCQWSKLVVRADVALLGRESCPTAYSSIILDTRRTCCTLSSIQSKYSYPDYAFELCL